MAHNFDSGINIGGVGSGGEKSADASIIRSLRHPFVVLAHVGFRALALAVYLFAGILSLTYISAFVLILVLLSADFWVVKNISGRLLAGVRWWNLTDEDGHSRWRFEVTKVPERYDSTEVKIFWAALFLSPVLWLCFTLLAFATFKWLWMLVALMGSGMSLVNLYGYLRCRWSSAKEATSYLLRRALFSRIFSNVVAGTETV